MNYQNKTKDELINELLELQQKYNSFVKLHEKDTIELKQTDESLKENEFFLRESERIAKMGSWQFDLNNHIVKWSENCFVLYGLNPFEIEPTFDYFKSRVHPEDLYIIEDALNNILKNKLPDISELRIIFPDGTIKWIQNNMILVYKDEKPSLLKGIQIDITERKQKELIIEKQNQELRELNETKDKFFSIIAHDLRSPFTQIYGFSSLLKSNIDKYDSIKIVNFVEMINSGAKNAMDLMENLFTWAMSQKGELIVKIEPINISELINEKIENHTISANNKVIELSYNQNSQIYVLADKNMVKTILRNLISNAIKFTNEKGKIEINVIKNDNYVEISVSDNGIGISEENISKLFRMEESISTNGTANEKGTGLGLIISKEFVIKNGGEIWVESKLGNGCNFKFTLPLCEN